MTASLTLAGFLVVALGVAAALLIDFDSDGLLGAAIGAGLGLVNLAVGSWVTLRSVRKGMKSAMRTLLGGFLVRLLVVATLVVVFHRTEAVDAVAFALTFFLFFFAYLALEVLLVERLLNGSGRPA